MKLLPIYTTKNDDNWKCSFFCINQKNKNLSYRQKHEPEIKNQTLHTMRNYHKGVWKGGKMKNKKKKSNKWASFICTQAKQINTCSELAIEPWQASINTLVGSPKIGWAWSCSFNEFMSSQPVMNTKMAPGLSLVHMWHKAFSVRLKPIESGFQQARDSRVLKL